MTYYDIFVDSGRLRCYNLNPLDENQDNKVCVKIANVMDEYFAVKYYFYSPGDGNVYDVFLCPVTNVVAQELFYACKPFEDSEAQLERSLLFSHAGELWDAPIDAVIPQPSETQVNRMCSLINLMQRGD